MKQEWLRPWAWWFVAAVPTTLILLAAYAIVQQNYRESLNDPQIQMAEDAALALESGAVPAQIVPHGTPILNIAASLAPWVAVYDSQGQLLENSGELNGAPPQLPQGVFDSSQWGFFGPNRNLDGAPVAEDRFTWQPDPSDRQAIVLVQTPDKKYFVAAGRNMREVEQRIEHEGEIIFAAWFLTLAAALIASYLAWWIVRRI